jgi:adenosylcobinamide kinase/adenosylcobinamide-phosphate guanylyltransferase
MNERKLILILGGARSGKSALAQRLAASHADQVLFVATAEPGDDEMKTRIAKHRAERPGHWRTIEAPRAVAGALAEVDPPPIVLFDCVTLWVTNLLHVQDATWETAARELDALLAWYHAHPVELIVVSNEVGLGIVPADELSRTFREWLGWFNQRLAAEADAVYFMIAGLPVELKALVACPLP